MAIAPEKLELMHAVIDGEADESEREALQALLASDEEARAAHDELAELASMLNAVEAIPPPEELRYQILDACVPKTREPESGSFWLFLWSAPIVRYAGAFAAGAVLASVFISSDRISRSAFDDVTGLVGTISQPVEGEYADGRLTLSQNEIAGTVVSRREGPLMVIDFDLVSSGPVEIVADFSRGDIWFNGFAQLENPGTSVLADVGKVTLQMDGKRRYAVYLYNGSAGPATVNLKFFSRGRLLAEEDLQFGEAN